jgi:hypothetical protein
MVGRIDETPMLVQQAAYLAVTGLLLGAMLRFELLEIEPPGWLKRPWRYVEHAMHFMLGTLLNAYALFYVKSGSGATAVLFLVLISLLLLVNEHPRFHRLGPVVLFGLYSFSLTSYLAYLLPVLLGHLRAWMFFLASALSLVPIVLLARRMARWGGDSARAPPGAGAGHRRAGAALALFVAHLVPPEPLSVLLARVWHGVEREERSSSSAGSRARAGGPPGARTRGCSSPVRETGSSPSPRLRPRQLRDQVRVRWAKWEPARREWTQSDAIPLRIVGGREEGFGGYAYKQNWTPGEWRVSIETEDGREIGGTRFEIEADPGTDERVFDVLRG